MSLTGTTDGIPNSILAVTPLLAPPAGVTSNFVNPPSLGPNFIIVGAILLPFVALFVGIRMITKLRILRQLTWDDASCLTATLLLFIYYTNEVLSIKKGHFGVHGWNLSILQSISPWFGWTVFIENWISTLTLATAKLTFFIFYLQLFRPNKALRYGIYLGIGMTVVLFLAFAIAQIVLLVPHAGQSWLAMYSDPREMDANKISIPISVASFIIDMYTFIIPMAGVANLKLSNRKKMGVMLVFLTGLGACVASSLSIYYKTILNKNMGDSTWVSMPVIICALIEMCIGIICSCMPSVSKFVNHHFPDFSLVDTILSLRGISRISRFHSSMYTRSRKSSKKSTGASESDENLSKKISGPSELPSPTEEEMRAEVVELAEMSRFQREIFQPYKHTSHVSGGDARWAQGELA